MQKNGRKILILCDSFGPPAYVPRVSNLAINLQKEGWQVTVLSEIMPNVNYQTHDFPLSLMLYYTHNRFANKLRWLADQVWLHKEQVFRRYVEMQTQVADYDIILCSTFNVFPLLTAQKLARKYQKPLLVDLRDITEEWGSTPYFAHQLPSLFGLEKTLIAMYEKRNIWVRNRVLKTAAAVTTISPWHRDFLRQFTPNVHLIYNGFNRDAFYPNDVPNASFIISYTGRIYDFKLRNPHLLFAAMQRLITEQKIAATDVKICFYSDKESLPILNELAAKCDLQEVVTTQPYVPNSQVLQILHESSVILILANKTTEQGPFGIMTTKFFEALGVEKPVLCVRSDEDCLAQAIADTNAGLAATNVEETMAFILDKYNEWKANGYTRQAVKNKAPFTRQEQAKQFAAVLHQISNKA